MKTRIDVNVPLEMKNELTGLANAMDVTLTMMVRMCIEKGIRWHEKKLSKKDSQAAQQNDYSKKWEDEKF